MRTRTWLFLDILFPIPCANRTYPASYNFKLYSAKWTCPLRYNFKAYLKTSRLFIHYSYSKCLILRVKCHDLLDAASHEPLYKAFVTWTSLLLYPELKHLICFTFHCAAQVFVYCSPYFYTFKSVIHSQQLLLCGLHNTTFKLHKYYGLNTDIFLQVNHNSL